MIPYKDLSQTRRFPFITILLVIFNIAIFLYQTFFLSQAMAENFVYRYAVIPLEFRIGHNLSISPGIPPIFSIFTAMFLHGGWLHLIGNMLYLWIFGDNVEEQMGSFRFLFFYLLCGVVATLAQIYGSFSSDIPSLGASGAIAGVLAAYLRLNPKGRIAVLIPIFFFLRSIVLPAWLVLGFWFLIQILEAQMPSEVDTGGIAYFAHIGGFVAGLLLTSVFISKKKSKRGF